MFCSDQLEKKNLVIKAGILLSEKKLVERTWGNVSVRFDSEHFAISPTGALYEKLKPEDIPVVNLKEFAFIGKRKPSSELLIHSSIYATYPDVSFILHTHQRFASLLSLFFSNKQGTIEVLGEEREVLGKIISIAEYAQGGTKQIAENVIKALDIDGKTSFRSSGIVLMAAHGVLCFAPSFDVAFDMVQLLEDFAKRLVLTVLRRHNVFVETGGELFTYTRTSFYNNAEDILLNKLCSLIFNEDSDISFITLSSLPMSKYVSEKLDIQVFPNEMEFALNGIPAYFDDVAQILGETAIVISNINDIIFFQKHSKAIFEKSNALIIIGVGVLFFSHSKDEAFYMASIFEKNALAFLLSFYIKNIVPLAKENANLLHTSFIKGYSKLKDF